MAGRDQGANLPRRRFITRVDVQDAAARGESLKVGPRDVVTDEAEQRAADLGVPIERGSGGGAGGLVSTGSTSAGLVSTGSTSAGLVSTGSTSAGSTSAGSTGDLRRAVRAAVVAELGQAPPALDQVIDKVLKGRGLG